MGCFKKEDPRKKASKDVDKKIRQWMRSYQNVIKLLLLGPGESGKTTIIKQMKILHVQGFSNEERLEKATEIRRNVLDAIKELAGNMAFLQPPIQLADESNRDSLDFINSLNTMTAYDPTEEFYEHTKRLWADGGIHEAYRRSNEFQLIDSAKYFLDKLDVVKAKDYIPSDQDILCSRKRTSDIQKIQFQVKVPSKFGRGGIDQEFWMFDVGGQRGERRKWIMVFDGITAVLFLVACSGYDSKIREDNATNRLEEALQVFEEVWFSRFLRQSGFILFFNKQDVLEEKIKNGRKLEMTYPDFENYSLPSSEHGDNTNDYHRARCFIKEKFLSVTTRARPNVRYSAADLYYDLGKNQQTRECYWHYTTATDTDNIQKVFEDIHVMIVMENLNKIGGALH